MPNVCAKELGKCILFTKVDSALLVLEEPVSDSQRWFIFPWNRKHRLHRGNISVSVEREMTIFLRETYGAKAMPMRCFPRC